MLVVWTFIYPMNPGAASAVSTSRPNGKKSFQRGGGDFADLAWQLALLAHVVEVGGVEARLNVDANEAWSPKEAISRL